MERVLVPTAGPVQQTGPRRMLRFESAALTHAGYRRDNNEDFVFAGQNLIAVADGVGGNVSGEVASELVIEAIAYLEDGFVKPPLQELSDAAHYANLRVSRAIEDNRSLLGMATTLSALRLDGAALMVLHIGDSRAYGLCGGAWVRLTRDDSLIQGLLDAGEITEAEALEHPSRSVVLQALNGGAIRPHIAEREVSVGDRYLVCSDGLSDYVPDLSISQIVAGDGDPSACCTALVEAALAAGAPDNVSVVVADVRELIS